jgi:hypothetical protein
MVVTSTLVWGKWVTFTPDPFCTYEERATNVPGFKPRFLDCIATSLFVLSLQSTMKYPCEWVSHTRITILKRLPLFNAICLITNSTNYVCIVRVVEHSLGQSKGSGLAREYYFAKSRDTESANTCRNKSSRPNGFSGGYTVLGKQIHFYPYFPYLFSICLNSVKWGCTRRSRSCLYGRRRWDSLRACACRSESRLRYYVTRRHVMRSS